MTGLNNESNTPELASLNRIKDIAQKEHNTVKNDDLAHEATREYQAKNDRYKSDTLDRKWLAEWSSTVVTIWLAGVLFILCSNTACFKLSDTVLSVLLGTTTLNVLGLVFIVLRGHFDSSKG